MRWALALLARLKSAYFATRFWRERSGQLRRRWVETPAGVLTGLPEATAARIEALAGRYGARFETRYGQPTALQCYAYLDLLDQAFSDWGIAPPRGLELHDVGSASFGYAAALVTIFAPARLTGFEIEGYRRLKGGVNRHERALGLIQGLARVEYRVADYALVHESAGLVTAFFPFVTATPVLAWRMPLSVLAPARLFGRIRENLGRDATLVMVNHSPEEAVIAARYAREAGLARQSEFTVAATLEHRPQPPVVSRWTAGGSGPQG